jgi:hypothetical protein
MRGARHRWAAWSAARSLRGAGCLSIGLLVVHQLRVLAGPSSEHHAPFSALAVPSLVLLVGALVALAFELAGVRRGRAPTPKCLSIRRAWLMATLALLVLFVAQELLEGLFLHGHVGGLAGVYGLGGWTALPLAIAMGGIVALAVVGMHSALRRAADTGVSREPTALASRAHAAATWRPAGVLARKLASRAPPAATV